MRQLFKIAAIAIPVALAPMQAHANPMVAVGWLWAAGAGGVVLGVLGTMLYQQNRVAVVTPAYAEPAAYQPQCQPARVKYQGRWHNVQICD